MVKDKIMANVRDRTRKNYKRTEVDAIFADVIYKLLTGITGFKGKDGFDINSLKLVSDMQTEVPEDFRKRFYFIMDILYDVREYAEISLKTYHPRSLEIYEWFFRLYIDEVPVVKKSK